MNHFQRNVVLLTFAMLLGSGSAFGQGYYGGYVDNRASTVGESYARGVSDMVRSAGAANLSNSQAANNYEDARSKNLDNRLKGTNTYFEMRALNKQYRAAERGPRPTEADAVRYAHMNAPAALSESELDPITGKIRWPIALVEDVYAADRAELESLFKIRSGQTYLKMDDRQKAEAAISEMRAQLKSQIREMQANTYLAARNFLESLHVAVGQAAG